MVNGLHLYSAFIQSAVQFMPLIHPFTHQQRLAAMQGTKVTFYVKKNVLHEGATTHRQRAKMVRENTARYGTMRDAVIDAATSPSKRPNAVIYFKGP